jgi:NAD(P)-dependent dehydrogenase (short-subunit alcohol dehydrogenase family)
MKGAIVTGGSSGIGRAVAVALAAEGYDVAVTARANASGAEATCDRVRALGRRAAWARLDLSEPEAAERAIGELWDRLGSADVLVNNAGANRRVGALGESVADFRRILDINLVGPFACARAHARRLVDGGREGAIVNVTSVLAHAPLGAAAVYCASKSALDMLTRVLALEWAAHGIRVNAVAPGHTVTPMNFADADVSAQSIARPQIPIGRPASPEEVAAAVAFLAGDSARYASGTSVTVDGGLLLVTGPAVLEAAHRNEQAER